MTLRDDCNTKLTDAKTHLADMNNSLPIQSDFNRHLAAFLTAIRSPLQYIHGTADPNSGKQPPPNPRLPVNRALLTWYQLKISSSDILKFFKIERDLDIHQRPVSPLLNATVGAQEFMPISDEAVVIETNVVTGDVVVRNISDQPIIQSVPGELISDSLGTMWSYEFTQWTADSNKDVITLCQRCINEVEQMIQEGTVAGHIT